MSHHRLASSPLPNAILRHRGLTAGQEASRRAPPKSRAKAIARALPAPSLWLLDLVALGLIAALIRWL